MTAFAHDYRAAAPRPREWRIVASYVAIFFGALPALLWAIGGRLDALLAIEPLHGAGWRIAGATLAASGAAWMAWSMACLALRGRGLPISHLPPVNMVARGPYAWTRHPIYVGYTALFVGAGLATGSLGRGFFAGTLLAAGSIVYALGFEEPRLHARFGASYAAYSQRVPSFPFASVVQRVAVAAWHGLRPMVEVLANRIVLFRIGPTVWVTFGAFAAAGTMSGLAGCHLLIAHSLSRSEEAAYLLGLAVWMLFGARVAALLYQLRLLCTRPLEALRRVGFVSWGGYAGLFTFPFVFAPATQVNPWWLLDRALLPALLCSSIGRLGCLSYGCCYGKAWEHGLTWRHPEAKPIREHGACGAVARVPTQLLSSLHAAALVPVVVWMMTRSAPGVATIVGSLCYVFGRFAIECLRDEPRFLAWRLTRGQLVCAGAAAVAVALLLTFPASPNIAQAWAFASSASPLACSTVTFAGLVIFVACGLHIRRVGRW